MRQDMRQVIIERPRRGSCAPPRRRLKFKCVIDLTDIDTGKQRASIKSHLRDNVVTKQQTDLLSPLLRFLHKQVGRPWNDVFSEICQHADYRNVAGRHLREHTNWFVAKPRYINGELVDQKGRTLAALKWGGLYVDPVTGLLCSGPPYKKYRRPARKSPVVELAGQQFHNHEGIWYRVWMHPWPFKRDVYDAFLGCVMRSLGEHPRYGAGPWEKYGNSPTGQYWYCGRKEAANRKEIAKLRQLLDQ